MLGEKRRFSPQSQGLWLLAKSFVQAIKNHPKHESDPS
jgi:hypothetical protein